MGKRSAVVLDIDKNDEWLENIEKAKASFGKWEERDKSSKEIVKELRKDGKRRYNVLPVKEMRKKHPAFGIWADSLSEGSSAEIAEELREKIESRANGAQ